MLDMRQAAEQVLFLAEKKKLKDVDIVVERNESLDLEIQDGKVDKVEQSTSLGLGVRVLDQGRTGLASTERLSSEAIELAFKNACENAKLQDPTEVIMLLHLEDLVPVLKKEPQIPEMTVWLIEFLVVV